jgi:hypothetical protein
VVFRFGRVPYAPALWKNTDKESATKEHFFVLCLEITQKQSRQKPYCAIFFSIVCEPSEKLNTPIELPLTSTPRERSTIRRLG